MNRRDVIALSAAILSSPFAISAAWSVPDARVADLVKSGKIRAGLAVAPIMATKDARLCNKMAENAAGSQRST
jgi:hypothetical protein